MTSTSKNTMQAPADTSQTTPLRRLLKYIEVPIDANADYKNDHYTNRDLIPTPANRRTYSISSYFIYWCISGMCISAYTVGSTLLAYGLSAPQAIGAIIIGAICTGCLSVACGWMGERHHIGFTVASRFTWGMRGAYFPVIVRSFTQHNILGWPTSLLGRAGYDCTTTQIFITVCVKFLPIDQVTLGAIIPRLAHMTHTLAGGVLLTKDLIGMIIMRIPPERLQRPFVVSSVMFGGTLIGLLAWATTAAKGVGPLFQRNAEPAHGSVGWAMMFGITAILGSWGGGTLGQSDWTRYAGQPYAPTLSQLIAAPFFIILCATVGIVVTSCGEQIFGALIWEPFALLAQIQEFYHDSSRVRAGVFFAGLGCVCAQLGISIVLNSVSAGMDLAGLAPRYLNIRRGAYVLAAMGLISNPWQYLSKAATFLTVISGFGIFFGPFTGVMLADYLVVRRGIIKLEDCYIGDSSSLYWYNGGFHWRALVAWALGVFPTMPGFVMTMQDATAYNGWIRIFNIAFFVGLAVSFIAFWMICNISPPPGVGVGTNYHDKSRSLFVGPLSRTERLDKEEGEGTEKMVVSV
ncbi:permease for cytosine/purines, uracil, thiamine, allantoin-domain-containing protein [Mycena alexandri]|uniref:Permease for cytosine/purines, uracil, thiamine, allantoin-domain-containing protein n=1 Tax=Mycena alexandri TaxID=1745969 RepID=A0AAD6T9H5_9AGAR|nr:permease for cytosine/purines, uracil, thiamine, allantoin-domain-containing protein [Mycena alexandri]